jgi:serine/threonine protein kinase
MSDDDTRVERDGSEPSDAAGDGSGTRPLSAGAGPVRRASVSMQSAVVASSRPVGLDALDAGEGPAPPRIAGYEVLRLLGEGGMGAVWEALEHRFDRRVAVKVDLSLSGRPADELFREARIAAQIDDPALVRVHDYGFTLDEEPYFAMEYIEGLDLAEHLRGGPLPTGRAVRLALDIARAAAAAHERGIVHRDLKPRNIIVDAAERARVLDFGIAVAAEAGGTGFGVSFAGSPPYMAPEQIQRLPFGPEADVYAIGVILFQMLVGERPFISGNAADLLRMVVQRPAPRVSSRVSAVDADLDEIVDRCLRKDPAERFRSGRELFDVLLAVSEGRPLATLHPPVARHVPRGASSPVRADAANLATRNFRQTWSLQSSAAALWPFVSNTDRVNLAAGLGKVTASGHPAAENGFAREGKLRALGMDVEWQEFPFEWRHGVEHRVHRMYSKGPIKELWNHVLLEPRPDGGADLTHTISLVPRGVLGEVAAYVEIGQRVMRGLERAYRRIDQVLASRSDEDPFEMPHQPTDEVREAVERHAQAWVSQHGFPSPLVERLKHMLLHAPSSQLARIRASDLAARWREDPKATLDLLMTARTSGVLLHAWDIVCPSCRVAHQCVAGLSEVGRRGRCDACGVEFERDLRDSVELVFRPVPSVRETEIVMYCMGSPAARSHILMQQVLAPHESREVTLELGAGSYEFCASGTDARVALAITPAGFARELELRARDGVLLARPSIARVGAITIQLHNDQEVAAAFRVELPRNSIPVASASAALLHPSFREFASREQIARGDYISVSELTFVCGELEGLAEALARDGDAATFPTLERMDGLFAEKASEHAGGALGRPFASGLWVAAFPDAVSAVQAAVEMMRNAPDAFRVSVHHGSSLAFTRGTNIEYFGRTVHEGVGLLRELSPRQLGLSASLLASREVMVLLARERLSARVALSSGEPPIRFGAVDLVS